MRPGRPVGAFLLVALATVISAAAVAPNPPSLADWALVVAAGDDRAAHANRRTDAFDNARRALAGAFWRAGFSPAHTAEFSVRPAREADAAVSPDDPGLLGRRLRLLAGEARAGCLVYFTSHGSDGGVVFGERLLSPARLAGIVGRACGTRPTAVIVSACFSGVFVPALAAPNRLVFTAARRDRSSFGCGESDRYPFFDACVLEALPGARDLIALAPAVRRCVERREDQEGLRPRSEPQLYVGDRFAAALPAFVGRRLAAPPPTP